MFLVEELHIMLDNSFNSLCNRIAAGIINAISSSTVYCGASPLPKLIPMLVLKLAAYFS